MTTILLALVARCSRCWRPSPAAAPAAATDHVRLDGVDVRLREGTRQVVTVNRTSGYHARVTLWAPAATAAGSSGSGDRRPDRLRRPGAPATPAQAGHRHDPARHLRRCPRPSACTAATRLGRCRYRKVRRGDYWVQDNRSRYYNRYRNQSQGGFRWWLPSSDPNSSERLRDYRAQYEWSIVIGFNQRPGAPPRLRDLPARQRLRRHRRLRERAALVHQVADGPARPRRAAR